MVRERSDPVPSRTAGAFLLQSGACSGRRPAHTAPAREERRRFRHAESSAPSETIARSRSAKPATISARQECRHKQTDRADASDAAHGQRNQRRSRFKRWNGSTRCSGSTPLVRRRQSTCVSHQGLASPPGQMQTPRRIYRGRIDERHPWTACPCRYRRIPR